MYIYIYEWYFWAILVKSTIEKKCVYRSTYTTLDLIKLYLE